MKTTIKEYYECKRCKSNSLGDKWCPCPRGGCEAVLKGKIKTTVKIILDK